MLYLDLDFGKLTNRRGAKVVVHLLNKAGAKVPARLLKECK